MATTIHETENLARRAIEALNRRDQDAFVETHAEDVTLHHPRETYRGIEEVVDFQWAIFDAFSDLTFAIEAACAGDDLVTARYTVAEVHDYEFHHLPPTMKKIEMGVKAMMQVEDGEIMKEWLQPDTLGLLQQLGAVEETYWDHERPDRGARRNR